MRVVERPLNVLWRTHRIPRHVEDDVAGLKPALGGNPDFGHASRGGFGGLCSGRERKPQLGGIGAAFLAPLVVKRSLAAGLGSCPKARAILFSLPETRTSTFGPGRMSLTILESSLGGNGKADTDRTPRRRHDRAVRVTSKAANPNRRLRCRREANPRYK